MIKAASILATGVVIAGCAAVPPPPLATPEALDNKTADHEVLLRGVNLAGAEFGEDAENGGEHGVHYIYPIPAYVEGYETPADLTKAGFNTFRLPFLWERLQPELGGPLDGEELARLTETVDYLNGLGATVIVDPHNYARYRGTVIGGGVSGEAFADFWRRLAGEFMDNSRVVFGLMNEPNNMPTEDWVGAANAAIAAVRETGAENLILVPGNYWSGAHAWTGTWYGTSNARALLAIEDPLKFTAFEAHQYVNPDSSGGTPACVSPKTAARRLAPFTDWLRQHGVYGFLGEFGGGPNDNCYAAVGAMLQHMEDNADVYIGWTAWSAGPWWPEDYHLSLEPGHAGRPQLDVLTRYLSEEKLAF